MLAQRVTEELQLAVPRPVVDGPQLFQLVVADRERLTRFLPWVAQTQTVQDEVAFLQMTNRHLGQGQSLNLVIWVGDTVAGMISCNRFDQANRSADIGYWLGRPFRGRGVMTQAVRGLCTLVFQDYGMNRLVIRAAVENGASQAVARRAGFHLEGILRQNEKLADGYHDEYLFSYLRSEWAATRS
ncbi:GNAT family N-acetyltransferase [Levilactobacillus spicheri]|uniref:N-acetyltransferase domain-containing protein n=1 Tax=Levilactobacillus spicheri TaxID=216463 RepID=A0A0F3RP19_9LACO|nr:GNAT family protein [Levilactobacillus spicheri]KJW11600.1 hypothetical protein VC81_12365 [Levilactobacillus spicheri]